MIDVNCFLIKTILLKVLHKGSLEISELFRDVKIDLFFGHIKNLYTKRGLI